MININTIVLWMELEVRMKEKIEELKWFECKKTYQKRTRTTNVVRNAGCARSRYTLKLSFIFLINELMNQ